MTLGPEAAPDASMDVLLVGCGLRGAGLLTATPALFDRDLGVLDAADRLAVGSFDRYDIESNSSGSDFFGWIDPADRFGQLLQEEPVRALRSQVGPFHLSALSRALEATGRSIRRFLPPDRLFLGDPVVCVKLSSDGPPQVITGSGRRLGASVVVLATGIRERAQPELARWSAKSISSRRLLAPDAGPQCQQLVRQPGLICFAGASHSALSVLQRMLLEPPGPDTRISLVTRSPVRLHYDSWSEYRRVSHFPAEAVPDPARDVCPETGNVHRYSGLRHGSKRLFRAVAAGQVPGVELVIADNAAERGRWFNAADTVIAASGYQSDLPAIRRDGHPLPCTRPDGMAALDPSGRLLVGGVAGDVFVMGMDPYPYGDNALNPTNQYKRRGSHILNHLGQGQRQHCLPSGRSSETVR